MPPSTALASHPRRSLLSDSECATTSPYSPLPRLAIPEHRRPPAVVGLRWVTAALPCSWWQPPSRAPSPFSRLHLMAHLLLPLTVLQELPVVIDGHRGSSSSVGSSRAAKLHRLPTKLCRQWAPVVSSLHGGPHVLPWCGSVGRSRGTHFFIFQFHLHF
jgi:hypothetical protein